MKILAVDTSTQYTFLALCAYHDKWNTEKFCHVKTDRSKDNWLELLINDFCSGFGLKSLDGFSAGYGPGSFTGLRINFTYLKTLAIMWDKFFLTFSTSRFYHSVFCQTNEVLLVQANRNLYFACDPQLPDQITNIRTLPEWTKYYSEFNDQSKNVRLWNQYPALENAPPIEYGEVDPQSIKPPQNIFVEMPEPDYIRKNQNELMNSMPFYGHDVIINRK